MARIFQFVSRDFLNQQLTVFASHIPSISDMNAIAKTHSSHTPYTAPSMVSPSEVEGLRKDLAELTKTHKKQADLQGQLINSLVARLTTVEKELDEVKSTLKSPEDFYKQLVPAFNVCMAKFRN